VSSARSKSGQYESAFFRKVTWDDIRSWAGGSVTARGRSYQKAGAVEGIAIAPAGGLLAWVQGGQKYATYVLLEEGSLASLCTCPYRRNCKHAVALVLEYIENLKKNKNIPLAAVSDRRLKLLSVQADDHGLDDDSYLKRQTTDIPEEDGAGDDPRQYLRNLPRKELIGIIEAEAERAPEVYDRLVSKANLATGNIRRAVRSAEDAIDRVSSEPAWSNYWKGESNIPDYTDVRDRLKDILSRQHADDVLKLLKRLFRKGTEQVEESNDEGETANEIASCLETALKALPRSSLTPAEQILWLAELELEDEYGLTEGLGPFWKKRQKASVWSDVADKLIEKLGSLSQKGRESFHARYERDRMVDWTVGALSKAGRMDEAEDLSIKEVDATDGYVRVVGLLLKTGKNGDAERWIIEGVSKTRNSLPGIAEKLSDMLRRMREREGAWPAVAALRWVDFAGEPSIETFKSLKGACEKAHVWNQVRLAAIHFLESGEVLSNSASGKKASVPSPLPEPQLDAQTRKYTRKFPLADVLTDVAMYEKEPDQVLRWYESYRENRRHQAWDYRRGYKWEDEVADSIAKIFPESATGIWKNIAEDLISTAKTSAYEDSAPYLGKVRKLLEKSGKKEEWNGYLASLRSAHKQKRRFLEVLDSLTGKSIADT